MLGNAGTLTFHGFMLNAALISLVLGTSKPLVMPENLQVASGLVFSNQGRIELKIDVVRRPNFSNKPQPAVLFLHGGAWRDGRRDMPNPVQWELALRGYVCFTCDYRLSQEAIFPAQLLDVRDALKWIATHSSEYGVDSTRIGIWGMSAGGHLASLAAYAPDAFLREGESPVKVRAIAAIFPTTDLVQITKSRLNQKNVRSDLIGAASPEAQLLGANPMQRPDLAAAASPVTYITPDDPPTWIIHGLKDETVPVEQSRIMAASLAKAKVRHQLQVVPNLAHEAKYDLFEDSIVRFFDRELGPILP